MHQVDDGDVSVLRGLNRRSANGTPVRQVKVWGESPLTRLMWASGMADLRRANLYVLCENVMCRSVEGDETSRPRYLRAPRAR